MNKILIIVLLVWNLAVFALYGIDKSKAKHGALEGRKLDVIRKNSDCCVQIECDVKPFDGNVACQYGVSYYSLDGFGAAQILDEPQAKMRALSILMKTQTSKDFEFNEKLVSVVSVIRIECDYYTAKHRPLPVGMM